MKLIWELKYTNVVISAEGVYFAIYAATCLHILNVPTTLIYIYFKKRLSGKIPLLLTVGYDVMIPAQLTVIWIAPKIDKAC